MKISKKELRTALVTEREKLIKLLSETNEKQMKLPSLCEGWSNKNVIGHILGYELGYKDAIKLIFKKEALDSINNNQAERYADYTNDQLIKLLYKGQKRILRLLYFTPAFILNTKFIAVPNGRICLAQLFGDLAMDRAVHYLDIASPLLQTQTITDANTLTVSIKFMLKSIDLLNSSIPGNYYGDIAYIELHGCSLGGVYWKIGSDEITNYLPDGRLIITISGETNDFLFTIVGRRALIKNSLTIEGDKSLKQIFLKSLNANKLWEN